MENNHKGVIEGSSRVLAELLKTPSFTQTVRVILRELDPENTPLLVRAITRQDPELFLSVLSSTPAFANVGIEAARELLKELSRFPAPMFNYFLADIFSGIHAEALGESAGLLFSLISKSAGADDPALKQAADDFGQDFLTGFSRSNEESSGVSLTDLLTGAVEALAKKMGEEAGDPESSTTKSVQKITEAMKDISKKNPAFVTGVVQPLIEAGGEALALAQNAKDRGGDDD